jgi:hypothetical protein
MLDYSGSDNKLFSFVIVNASRFGPSLIFKYTNGGSSKTPL